jgi:hypothetical protein
MLSPRKYDIVWVKQTLVADRFLQPDIVRILWRYPKIDRPFDHLEGWRPSAGLLCARTDSWTRRK